MLVGGHNRAVIIGVGVWGARVIAHLWPRLNMVDRGRAMALGFEADGDTAVEMQLPRLSDVVGHILVLPDDDGSISIARPLAERWDDVAFTRQTDTLFGSSLAAETLPFNYRPSRADLRQQTYQTLWPTLDLVARYTVDAEPPQQQTRRTLRDLFVEHLWAISANLLAILEQARADENTPDEESSQLTLYVVASLNDELASAILWPLAQCLRSLMGPHVLTEMVGLLSTGTYSVSDERRLEAGALYVALNELDYLTKQAANGGAASSRTSSDMLLGFTTDGEYSQPFDRTFLIDREKTSGALIKNDVELTTLAGNALVALLTTEGSSLLRTTLAPDERELAINGPFSSLGAACIYIPLEEMWGQARHKLSLEILTKHLLGTDSDVDDEIALQLSDRLVQQRLDLSAPTERILLSDLVLAAGDVDEDITVAAAGVPEVSVKPPNVPFPRLRKLTMADLADHALAINEAFDSYEVESMEAWATVIKHDERLTATSVGPEEEATALGSMLTQIDNDVLRLITTQDRGIRAAVAYVAMLSDYFDEQKKGLDRTRSRWLKQTTSDAPVVRQQRLDWMSEIPFLSSLPSWSVLLLFIMLLTMILTTVAASLWLQVGLLTTFQWTIAAGLAVLIIGLFLRIMYQRWLQTSLIDIRRKRQQRLNLIGRIIVADAQLIFLTALVDAVKKRLRLLEKTVAQLEQTQHDVSVQLREPLVPTQSFVRQPLSQEELYDVIRSQPAQVGDGALISRIFREDVDSLRLIRQVWKGAVWPDVGEERPRFAQSEPVTQDLTEALNITIERYAARLSQPVAPTDVNVEDLLPRAIPGYNAHDFLNSLRRKAKPCIHIDDHVVTAPIGVDIMAVPFAPATSLDELGDLAAAWRLRLLSSYDPFALIMLRTLHHLPLKAVSSLRSYASYYAQLSQDEKEDLLLSEAAMAESDEVFA